MNPQLTELLTHMSSLRTSWLEDVRLRSNFPMTWRPGVGLAIMVKHFDRHAVAHGSRVFFPNHALTWLAMRDLPPRDCPNVSSARYNGATIVDAIHATIAFGMPRLDFSAHPAHSWNFRRIPDHSVLHTQKHGQALRPDVLDTRFFGQHWAVLNRMSALLTADAANVCARGNISVYDKRWHRHRMSNRSRPPIEWMPRAYLVFRDRDLRLLNLRPSARHMGHGENHPIVSLDVLPSHVLVAASAVNWHHPLRPLGLWWDITPAGDYLDFELESFILPPLTLSIPNRLRWSLPGDVELNATTQYRAIRRLEVPQINVAASLEKPTKQRKYLTKTAKGCNTSLKRLGCR